MAPPRKPALSPIGPTTDSRKVCRKGVRNLTAAGEFIGKSKSFVRLLIDAGTLTSFKVGNDRVVPVTDLIDYLANLRDEQVETY